MLFKHTVDVINIILDWLLKTWYVTDHGKHSLLLCKIL